MENNDSVNNLNNLNSTENPEWYDDGEPEVDFNELNKTANITRYANTNNNNIDYSDIKPALAYEKLKTDYEKDYTTNLNSDNFVNQTLKNQNLKILNQTDTTANSELDSNPIHKFDKIKNEIDLIAKDLEFYSKNKGLFPSKYSLEKSFTELKNLQIVTNFIFNSENYKIIKDIQSRDISLSKDSYHLLNRRIYEKLNEHLLNKIKIINRLKADNIKNYENVEYELYLTPDTMKVKLFTKLMEIKRVIQHMESNIGNWDIKSKKQSISEVVNNTKNHLRLFDKEYQKEIQTKMDALNTRLKEINEGKEEFYQSINKSRIDELYKNFNSSKQVEDLIFKTVTKMESLQNNHEESAYIFLKLKEMIEQQEKVSLTIDDNSEVLSELKQNLGDNLNFMKKNIANIKERLSKLKK